MMNVPIKTTISEAQHLVIVTVHLYCFVHELMYSPLANNTNLLASPMHFVYNILTRHLIL